MGAGWRLGVAIVAVEFGCAAASGWGQGTPAPGGKSGLGPIAILSAAKSIPPKCATALERAVAARDARALVPSYGSQFVCANYLVLSSSQYQVAARQARVDELKVNAQEIEGVLAKAFKTLSQQTGSSGGTGGSTNLTSKGAASRFFSVASEYGALTESTSGQTTTVSGSLAGLPVVLLQKGALQFCPLEVYRIFQGLGGLDVCVKAGLLSQLSRISYSVGFDTSTNGQGTSATVSNGATGTAVPATFQASSSHSINAVSVKWIAVQGTPSKAAIVKGFKDLDSSSKDNEAKLTPLYDNIALGEGTPAFGAWQGKAFRQMQDVLDSRAPDMNVAVLAAWQGLADDFVAALMRGQEEAKIQSDLLGDAARLAVLYNGYVAEEEAVGLALERPAVLTFEYDENRPVSQPSNSVFRGIFQKKVGGVTMTLNGAASIYDAQPPASATGSGRLRDVQVAFQADHDFSLALPSGKVGLTASGSFYFQDQTSAAILNVTPGAPVAGVTITGLPSTATQIFAQKGNIAIGQGKVTVGSGSNLKVPLSFTYSNRTELLTSPEWRGQIGISYDFDSLFKGSK